MEKPKTNDRTGLFVMVDGAMIHAGHYTAMESIDLKRGLAVIITRFPEGLMNLMDFWGDIEAWCLAYNSEGKRPDSWKGHNPLLWIQDPYVDEAYLSKPQARSYEDKGLLEVSMEVCGKIEVVDQGKVFWLQERGDIIVVRGGKANGV